MGVARPRLRAPRSEVIVARRASTTYAASRSSPDPGWTLRRLESARALARGPRRVASNYAERYVAAAPWSVIAPDLSRRPTPLSLAGVTKRVPNTSRSARSTPTAALAHRRLGTMAFEEGDDTGALAAWTSALERSPDDGCARRPRRRAPRARRRPRAPVHAGRRDDRGRARERSSRSRCIPAPIRCSSSTTRSRRSTRTGARCAGSRRCIWRSTTDGRDALIRTSVPIERTDPRSVQRRASDGARQEASSIRGGTVRFRGLEAGSRVVLQYVFHAPPPAFLPNHFVSSWVFQGIHRQLGSGAVGGSGARRARARHACARPDRTRRRARRDPTTRTRSPPLASPPLVPEPSAPPVRDLIAMVTLSTLTDWQEYVDWERALLERSVREQRASSAPSPTQLTEGASQPARAARSDLPLRLAGDPLPARLRRHDRRRAPPQLSGGPRAWLRRLQRQSGAHDPPRPRSRDRSCGSRCCARRAPGGSLRTYRTNSSITRSSTCPAQEGIDEGFFMDPTTDGLDMGNLRSGRSRGDRLGP